MFCCTSDARPDQNAGEHRFSPRRGCENEFTPTAVECCLHQPLCQPFCHSDSRGASTSTLPHDLDIIKLTHTRCHHMVHNRSTEEGFSSKSLDPAASSISTHKGVSDTMADFVPQWVAGKVWRGHDLGFLGLSKAFWPQVPDNTSSIGFSVEQHSWVRPILDKLVGAHSSRWSVAKIEQSAGEYIDRFIHSGAPFKVPDSIQAWCHIFLHQVQLGVEITDAEALEIVEIQNKVLTASIMPSWVVSNFFMPTFQQHLKFRAAMLEKYKAALPLIITWDRSDEDLMLLASVMLDSIVFAGPPAVTTMISCALGIVYSDESPCTGMELNEETIDAILWECVRLFPPVVGFAWFDGLKKSKRTILWFAEANRDPEVWSDPDTFKLRDLAEHRRLCLAWADKAVDSSNPAHNHACPAKDLSLACATGFLREWAKRQDLWQVRGRIKFLKSKPYVSGWEFRHVPARYFNIEIEGADDPE